MTKNGPLPWIPGSLTDYHDHQEYQKIFSQDNPISFINKPSNALDDDLIKIINRNDLNHGLHTSIQHGNHLKTLKKLPLNFQNTSGGGLINSDSGNGITIYDLDYDKIIKNDAFDVPFFTDCSSLCQKLGPEWKVKYSSECTEPSIGCKRNSSGRDIIERIQLKAGHGEYLHYGIDIDESNVQQYFAPITLHRLNIQLWAVNNVLYDSNNSDASFEFEITMVKNKKLLV